MKRFMAILFAAAVFSVTAAQAQIIHVKSTTITTTKAKKEKPKRERSIVPLRHGYRGFADANFTYDIWSSESYGFDLTTTHGYQFNDFIFIGAGSGIIMSRFYYDLPGGYKSLSSRAFWGIPLYAALQCYFTRRTAVKPFAEVRVGGAIGLNKYGEMSMTGFCGGAGIGIEYRHLFFKAGIEYRSLRDDDSLPIRIGVGYSF